MKKIILLAVCFLKLVIAHAQTIDSLSTEKKLREKILSDIQATLGRKNASFDSTITQINNRVDNLDDVIRATSNVKEKADKLLERVQVLESKQVAEEENELNIYQANYQSAIVNLVSMEREIKPLLLFDASRSFFSDLNEAGNPMNYAGYKNWFSKFSNYIKDRKGHESLLAISNNLLIFSGNTAQYVPVVGPISSVLFAGMSTYVTSLGKRQKALREESEKMITLTMKVSQFDYDKGEIEHEWELITDELMGLQNVYTRALNGNLVLLKIDSLDFKENFSSESDAEKRYLYLTAIRKKASDYVDAQKKGIPKDWKEGIYNQMMQIQSLKMRFGQITFRINENINKYGSLFEKYKSDAEVGIKMTILRNKLEQLKDIFDKAFDPLDYINSATRMYKIT